MLIYLDIKIPHLQIAHLGGNLEVGNIKIHQNAQNYTQKNNSWRLTHRDHNDRRKRKGWMSARNVAHTLAEGEVHLVTWFLYLWHKSCALG